MKEELLAQALERLGAHHDGSEREESGVAKAERIVEKELKKRRWTEEELRRRRKGDPAKVRIAVRLRQETTMTLEWIARRLEMGAWTYVSNLLRLAKNEGRQGSVKSKD